MLNSDSAPAARLLPDTAQLMADDIEIGGCSLLDLTRTYGTPLYVLDETTILNRIAAYHDGLRDYAGGYAIYYACKALINRALVQMMARRGVGFDVVSIGELATVQRAGVDLGQVHMHGNGTPIAELQQAIGWQIGRLVVDNFDQLQAIREICRSLGRRQQVLLRVAPDVIAGGHRKIQTGAESSKFGFNISDGSAIAAAEQAAGCEELALIGLHVHTGSQIAELDPLRLAVGRLMAFFLSVERRLQRPLAELCLGGGLGVATADNQPQPTISQYCSAVIEAIGAHGNGRLPRISVEPGRSLVARAGVACYSVTGRKELGAGPTYLHLDGGMGDNVRPSLYGAGYEALLVNRPQAATTVNYRLAGRYCESGDILIDDVVLPAATVGDVIAVPVSGAYTLSMGSNYNGVGRPPLLLLHDGQADVMQRRETVDDMLARDGAYYLGPAGAE